MNTLVLDLPYLYLQGFEVKGTHFDQYIIHLKLLTRVYSSTLPRGEGRLIALLTTVDFPGTLNFIGELFNMISLSIVDY